MINLIRLKYTGLRLLKGRESLKDVCEKQWILAPSEKSCSPSAIYLDGELDKVIDIPQEWTNEVIENQRIKGGIIEHDATIAYQLCNTQINSGYLYKRAMKLPLTQVKEPLFELTVRSEKQNISEASLSCSLCGNTFFSHWLIDDLILTLAAERLAKPIRTEQKLTSHQLEYIKLLDINSTPITKAQFQKLIVLDDVGKNKYSRERYEYIRSKLKAIFPPRELPGVMLLRGNSGVKRLLVNEKEIAKFLSGQGFVIIDPEKTSASDIVQKTMGAKIVVGVEGSQLAHGLFTLQETGALLALQPPYRFNNLFKDYTDCLGLKYSFVVGKQVNDGFEISIEDLARTLELIYSHLD